MLEIIILTTVALVVTTGIVLALIWLIRIIADCSDFADEFGEVVLTKEKCNDSRRCS